VTDGDPPTTAPHADTASRIARAELAERLLIRLGWAVLVVGVVAVVAEVAAIATGVDDLSDGVVIISGILLGVILAGAAAFGSGVNIGINLERLRNDVRARDRD
jgi:hypothetical protein